MNSNGNQNTRRHGLTSPVLFVLTAAFCLFFCVSTGPAYAQVNLTPAQLIGERPGEGGAPLEVSLGVFVMDINEIDDVGQRFNVDMFVNGSWQDPRLALPEGERSGQIRTMPLDQIWTPRGLVVNDRGLTAQLPLVASVDATGNVIYRQRFSGELAADLTFSDFPFDKQRLPIFIVSYQYSPDELSFTVNSRTGANMESFSAEGWRFESFGAESGVFELPATGISRPRLTVFIDAARDSQYYVYTLFLPMSLIVFMAWTAFWIQPNVVPPRIAISTGSIFSLIAFGFSIRLSLPRVSYITRADIFLLGCMFLVFVALGIAVMGSRWAGADKMDQALRLNAATRWIYLLLFGLVGAVTFTA